jgi:hypothetical protein
MNKEDMRSAVRFVDDFMDKDPRTRQTCPGTVNGNKLVLIAKQTSRRFGFLPSKIKNVIFIEKGTRNIWYKRSICNVGVVKMGFSLSRLDTHPSAIPMEEYARRFIDRFDVDWLVRNNYSFI